MNPQNSQNAFWRDRATYRSTNTGLNENTMRSVFFPPGLSPYEKGDLMKLYIRTRYKPLEHNRHFRMMIRQHLRELSEYGITYVDSMLPDRLAEIILCCPQELKLYPSGGYWELTTLDFYITH